MNSIPAFENFYFENFTFNSLTGELSLIYSFDEKEFFEEKFFFPSQFIQHSLDEKVIHNILFHLHIAFGISYYKLFPTKKLIIKTGFLDSFQKAFWKKFYLNGLGEFFVQNNFDPNGMIIFENDTYKMRFPRFLHSYFLKKHFDNSLQKDKNLLLFGGGKDSIVSSHFIQNTHFDTFVFGKLDTIKKNTLKVLQKEPLLVTRQLSQKLFEFNEKGYYNGHVPITGMIAFATLMCAYLYGYSDIILSNEKSSNEENMWWKDIKINHQYSKSFEFEKDFSVYIQKYISKKVHYFSLLRGMYEYKIADIFAQKKEFFSTFSSCNANFSLLQNTQSSLWCNDCPKCVFVFLMLSNFLEMHELTSIFGENLFEKKSLEPLFGELIGLKKHKPFECVGTIEESFLSMYHALKKYSQEKFYVLEALKTDVLKIADALDIKKLEDKLLKISDEDIIPLRFKKLLK